MGWGDELMVTGQVRERQVADPRKVRIVYERPRWHEAWDFNPRIARPEERGDFQVLQPRDGYKRPYIAEKHDDRWVWRPWAPPRGELYLTRFERKYGAGFPDRIILEPQLKRGASPNKDWGHARWVALAELCKRAGLPIAQLGPQNKGLLPGAEFIVTPTMRYAAAVLDNAAAAVLPEGGMHHVCAAVKTPAVVIFGGYIAPAVTGYDDQVSIFTGGGLGCGMRTECAHCRQAMAAIEPADVFKKLEELLETNRRSVAA